MSKQKTSTTTADAGRRPSSGHKDQRRVPPTRLQRAKSLPSVVALSSYAARLPTPATLHVNGPNHPTAIITLDFGQPLNFERPERAEAEELAARLRRAAADIMEMPEQKIHFDMDHAHGVWWASSAR